MDRKATTLHVSDLMTDPAELVHIDEPVQVAADRMRAREVGALPVVDGDELTGVISARDIATRGAATGRDPASTKVREVMTGDIVTCLDTHTVEQAAAIMEGTGVRRLAVTNENKELVGMLSADDLARDDIDPRIRDRVAKVTARKPAEPAAREAPRNYSVQPTIKR